MKNLTKNKMLLFCISVIILFLVPIYTIFENTDTLKGGNEYLFKVEAFDPYDMFRGNYINISFLEDEVDGIYKENKSDKYYVTIGTNKDGFSYFKSISDKKPKDTKDYYETSAYYYTYLNKYRIDTPTRYYMNEKKSLKAEKVYNENIDNTYVKVRVKNGKMAIVGVYVNNILIDSID